MDSPVAEAFYAITRHTTQEDSLVIWKEAIKEDPELAFKVALFTRDCRHGKGEKDQAYYFLRYIKENYPQTYVANLPIFLSVGYYKDLCALEEVDLFAEHLKDDLHKLRNSSPDDPPPKLSLAAKYAPSEGKSYNHLAKELSKKMGFSTMKEYRQAITSLRAKLNLIETLLTSKDYASIDYEKIPSKAHQKYIKCFMNKDKEHYQQYVDLVKQNKASLKTTHTYLHTIVQKCLDRKPLTDTEKEMWWLASSKFKDNRMFKDTIAVVDTSGSMTTEIKGITPLSLSVTLGLLIAENNGTGEVITFSDTPRIQKIKGETLEEKILSLSRIDWGFNTNMEAVYTLIREKQYNKVIVLSDMEFDQADEGKSTLPDGVRLVYWNLSPSVRRPTVIEQKNSIFVSGFSQVLFNLFLDDTVEFTTEKVIKKATECYAPVIIWEEFKK